MQFSPATVKSGGQGQVKIFVQTIFKRNFKNPHQFYLPTTIVMTVKKYRIVAFSKRFQRIYHHIILILQYHLPFHILIDCSQLSSVRPCLLGGGCDSPLVVSKKRSRELTLYSARRVNIIICIELHTQHKTIYPNVAKLYTEVVWCWC